MKTRLTFIQELPTPPPSVWDIIDSIKIYQCGKYTVRQTGRRKRIAKGGRFGSTVRYRYEVSKLGEYLAGFRTKAQVRRFIEREER